MGQWLFGKGRICGVTRSPGRGAIGVVHGNHGFACAGVSREVAEQALRSVAVVG